MVEARPRDQASFLSAIGLEAARSMSAAERFVQCHRFEATEQACALCGRARDTLMPEDGVGATARASESVKLQGCVLIVRRDSGVAVDPQALDWRGAGARFKTHRFWNLQTRYVCGRPLLPVCDLRLLGRLRAGT